MTQSLHNPTKIRHNQGATQQQANTHSKTQGQLTKKEKKTQLNAQVHQPKHHIFCTTP